METSTAKSAGSTVGTRSTITCSMQITKTATVEATGCVRAQGSGARTAAETSMVWSEPCRVGA